MEENKLLNFLLDKKSKGLPMNVGEAMSELDIWVESDGPQSMGEQSNTFRIHWENKNK